MSGLLKNNDIYIGFSFKGEDFFVTKNYEYTSDSGLIIYKWSLLDGSGYRLDKRDSSSAFEFGQNLIKSGIFNKGNGVGSLFGEDTSLEGQEIAKQMLETISE